MSYARAALAAEAFSCGLYVLTVAHADWMCQCQVGMANATLSFWHFADSSSPSHILRFTEPDLLTVMQAEEDAQSARDLLERAEAAASRLTEKVPIYNCSCYPAFCCIPLITPTSAKHQHERGASPRSAAVVAKNKWQHTELLTPLCLQSWCHHIHSISYFACRWSTSGRSRG